MHMILSHISKFKSYLKSRRIFGLFLGTAIGLPITLLFLISAPKEIIAQSTNPWNLYNNPTYGNALDFSLGPSTVDPPPLRLHSNGNMMVRTNLILGQTQAVNSQTWASTARGIVFNSATTPWWIRQNASDTYLAFGSSTSTADSSINFSIQSNGYAYLNKANSRLIFPEISGNTTGFTGISSANGDMADGVPFYGAWGREPGAWTGSIPDYVLNNHTGVRIAAHGGYGGVSIYEELNPAGTIWSSSGNEVARFRDNRYGGSYFNNRLGLGSATSPVTALDVNGSIQIKTGGIDAGGASANGARIMSTPNLHIDSQDGASNIYFNYWGGTGNTLFCDGGGGGVCNSYMQSDGILQLTGNYGRTTTSHAAGYYDINYPYEMHYYAGSEFMRSYMDGNWSYVINTQQSPASGHIGLLPKTNVGIGTNTPLAKLDVNITSGVHMGIGNWNNMPSLMAFNDGFTQWRNIVIAPAGLVGLGTATPNLKLDVANGSDGIALGQQYDNTNTIQTYIDGQWANRTSYAGGCCNKLLLQPDVGEVGIGITNPSWRLHVGGNPGTTTGAVRIDGILALNGYNPNACSTGGVFGLCVGGSSGGQSGWINTSDERLKENINTIPNALEKVLALRGVYFNFKNLDGVYKTLPKGKHVGFIAQEVEPILPEVVSTSQDGMKMMEYGSVTALLTEAIKEQQNQIEKEKSNNMAQQLEIAQLKQELEQLKKTIAELSSQQSNEH